MPIREEILELVNVSVMLDIWCWTGWSRWVFLEPENSHYKGNQGEKELESQ